MRYYYTKIGMFFLLVGFFLSGMASAQNAVPANARCIVVAQQPSSIDSLASSELAKYLKQSGIQLPIYKENEYLLMQTPTAKPSGKSGRVKKATPTNASGNSNGAIFVGSTRYATSQLSHLSELHNDGFIIQSDGENMCIYGNEGKATLYGVYDFLETHIGFRLYTPTALFVPHIDSLPLIPCDELKNPSFSYREILYYYPNHSQLYADWHKLHNRNDLNRDWGMFVHTFQHLIPANQYFSTHPEWFSEINGRRVRDGQLCLSNPEVLDELCNNLAEKMEKRPDAKIWSVSNNDNTNACTCPRCRHLDSLYGGPSGTLIHFVNQVARRFPQKTISTLAYQYTRQAPQNDAAIPDSNVNIMFCSIECGRQEPLNTASGEAGFRKDMENWARLTHNIFMWDYVVQFRNFLDPFPNLHTLQPNLEFFHRNGVQMMFEQGTGENNKTSWMELRTYLISKLLWDVAAPVDSIFHDFCSGSHSTPGYYGAAAPYIEAYYTEMHKSLIQSGLRLDIYGYPIDGAKGYLSATQIERYQQLLKQAYASVQGDSVYTDRIRYLELSLDFAVLDLAMSNLSPSISFTKADTSAGAPRTINEDMVARADRFVADCHRFGVKYLHEMGYSPDEYRADINNFLRKSMRPSLSFDKPVNLKIEPDKQYYAGGAQGLTDGVAGILNYHNNWLGFWGKPMDAVIDLQKKQPIHRISIDFFFYPLAWIFLPQEVIFYASNNGKRWTEVGRQSLPNPEILAVPSINTFHVDNLTATARYIRIVATPLPQIPSWHRAVGNPCWIFTDEVVVE